MSTRKLPPQFAELERFVEPWDLPHTNARYAKRLASTMEQLREFHDPMMARGEQIIAYLDTKRFNEYSPEDLSLARLTFAMAIVAQAVEIYKSVAVPDTGAASFNVVAGTEIVPESNLMSMN